MSQFLPALYDVFHSFPIIGPLLPRRADREVGTISLTQAYRNAVTELSLRPTLGQHEASSTNKSSNAVLDGEELDEACNFMRTWMNRVRDDAQSGDPFECPTNSHSSLHHIRCPPSVSIQHCSTRRESSLLDPFLIEVMMHVESLDLSGHQELTGRAVELLAQRWLNVRSVIQSTEGALLTRVNLSNCPIGDDGAMQLAQLIHPQGGSSPLLVRLRTLVLDAVDLTDEGCFTICTALTALHRFRRRQADHPSLFTPFRRLSLKNNHLSHRSVEVVLQTALEDHPSSSSTTDGSLVIQTVNLSFNNLHQEAATTTTTAYAVGMRLSSWAAFTSQDGSEDDNDDGDSTLSNAAHSSTTSSLVALREGLRRDGYLDDGEGHERGFCVLLIGCEWGTRDFSNMLLGIIAGYSPTLSEVVSAVAALISADTATGMNVPTDTPRIECEEGEESQEEEVESSSLTSDPPAASPLFGAVRPLLLLHHQQLNFLRCLDLSYTALDDRGVVELVHVILSLEEVCSGVLSVGLQRFSCLPHEEHRLGSLAHPLALLEELRLRGIGCTARSLPWLATLLLPLWEAPPTDDSAAAATSISDVDEEASEGDSASLSETSASVGAGMGRGVPSTAFLVSESYWRPAGSAVVESCASMEREVEGLQDLHELTSFAMHDVAEDSAVTPRPHGSSATTPPVRSHPDEGLHGATFPTIVRHFMLPNLRCLDLSENQLGEAPPSRRRRKHGCSGALLAAAVLRGSMRRTFDRHASHAAEETGRRSRSAVRHSCGEAGASNVADNHHGVDESEEDGAFSLGLDGCGLGDHAITVGLVVLAERHAFSQWSNPERNARGVTYHLGNNHFTHAGLVSLRMAVESTLKVNRQDSHYLYHVGRPPMAEGWVEGNYILADLSAATTAEHSISWTSLVNLEECPEKAPPTEVPAFASFLSQLRQASEEALYSPSLADQLSVTGLTSAMREQLLYSPRPRQGFTESTVAAPQVTAPLAEFQERTTEAKDQEVAGGATAAETLDLLIKGTDQFLAERIATSRRRELAAVDKDSTAVLASSLFGATVGGQK